ncbi:hypothetical protein Q1695_014379 [Nippostrongylus brasiliensis]|nr:hypothetical protein Q1695_014379 [Nippostrongylus brasiliensis]
MSCASVIEIAVKINSVMAKIQSELKCGICRSTFSNPVLATCGHVFCKDCLDIVFQRRRVVECPLCRQDIMKRSCTASEQHDAIVKGYLQLGRNFLRDSQEQAYSVPKDVAYMESQVPLAHQTSDSPMRDFRPTPQFAFPKSRARRKHPLATNSAKLCKMEEISEEIPSNQEKENKPALSSPKDNQPNILARKTEADIVRYSRSRSVEVQCNLTDPNCVCVDLRGSLASFRAKNNEPAVPGDSDLKALLSMMPELRGVLEENLQALCEVFNLQPCASTTVSKEIFATEDANQEHCLSDAITIDDFPIDDDDMEDVDAMGDTQPPTSARPIVNTCSLQKLEEDERPRSSSSRTLSDIVPQSPHLSEPDGNAEDDMDITINVPFDSIPQDTESCKPHGDVKDSLKPCSPIVLSASRLTCVEDEILVDSFVKMFPQVSFQPEITPSSTHLVMMHSVGSAKIRSLRYILAVARKCEILSRSWLEASMKSRQLLPTAAYTLASPNIGEEPAWLRARQAKCMLFDGLKFFLPPSFSNSRALPLDTLKELITVCGGAHFDKPWDIRSFENAYTIFMPQSTAWDAALRYEASMSGTPVVTAEWVMDSIAEYRLLPTEPYRVRAKV